LVALLAALVAGLAWCAYDYLVVDDCYDDGGAYLREVGRCSFSQAEIDRYKRPEQ
jgi:hypothetical protein